MRKRRILKLGICGSILLGIVFLFPGPRFILGGVFKGETFYRCMPSSYWSYRLREYFDRQEAGFPDEEPPTTFETELLDPLKERTEIGTPTYRFRSCPLPSAAKDLKVVPLFIDLLKDADPRVRYWSVVCLCSAGSRASAAVPALLEALNDESTVEWNPSVTVGKQAAKALIQIDPETARRVGVRGDPSRIRVLAQDLKSPYPDLRAVAARCLYNLCFVVDVAEMEQIVPVVESLLNDPSVDEDDPDRLTVGELCALILNRIDPKPAAPVGSEKSDR